MFPFPYISRISYLTPSVLNTTPSTCYYIHLVAKLLAFLTALTIILRTYAFYMVACMRTGFGVWGACTLERLGARRRMVGLIFDL